MSTDDKRTRFTLDDLPDRTDFEKDGTKQPDFSRKFLLIEPRPAPPGMGTRQMQSRFTLDRGQGFSPCQFAVKVPEFKSTKVERTVGLQGESTRDFQPLVRKTQQKGLSRDR